MSPVMAAWAVVLLSGFTGCLAYIVGYGNGMRDGAE